MQLSRFNAVGLIAGATSGLGAACAADVAKISQGGLILVDPDEAALSVVADDLEDAAPERVSMLAFDVADPDRWAQATDFIQSHYGRVDWAVVNAAAALAPPSSDLVEWRRALPVQLEGVFRTLRVLIPMMAQNAMGGAIVVAAPAAALAIDKTVKAGLAQLIRAAGAEAAPGGVRVNAIALDGASSPLWKKTPWFSELVKQTRSEAAAYDRISKLATPLVRYKAGAAQLVMTLLSDETPLNGATLIVDEAHKA